MMHNFYFFSISILLILYVSPFTIFVPIVESRLIEKTCKKCAQSSPNVKYDFCMTSLHAAPARERTSLKGLVSNSIKVLQYNVTDTRWHIKHWVKNKKWDRYNLQRLNDCIELYSDAILSVKEATKSCNDKRYDDANIQITSVMDDSTTCEEGLKEGGKNETSSKLSKRNENVFELGATTLCLLMLKMKGSSA